MIRLAIRNLVQNKTRLFISVGGLGLALTLVLFFDAVFSGALGRLTLYIDRAGADVWVSQQGVQTMHMSSSALPAAITEQVRAVPGVEEAMPVLYATDMIGASGTEYVAYVFGLPNDASLGRPFNIREGASMPVPGEVIIDHSTAASAKLGVGDQVTVLGREMTIGGLTSDTSSIANSLAFVTMSDFAQVRGQGQVVSFVLVKVKPGETAAAVATRIGQSVPGVTVQTRQQFAHEERKLVLDMSADLINIMNIAGFVTGLAVVALTVYIATIARRREYGVLKAIGTRNRSLYLIVLVQAFLSVALGLVASILLTAALSEIIPRFSEQLVLSISAASLLRVTVVSILLAGIAALLPARQIANLEPVTIIRRG